MLKESKRKLPYDLLKIAKPSPVRKRIKKDQKLAYIANGYIFLEYNGKMIQDLNDLVSEAIGYNVIINGSLSEFHKILMRFCDCNVLFRDRIVEWDNCKAYLADRAATFLNVRKGNQWGSIWINNDDEYGSIDCKNVLYGLNRDGWDIDRIMPAGKMAEHILKRKCIASSLPNFAAGDIDEIHLERALNCFRGSRMECSKLGRFSNIFNIDHNAAFLSLVRDLPSVSPMFVKWIDSKEYHSDAIMAFCYCRTYISEHSPFGLLATRLDFAGKRTRLFYNVGESEGWRTKDEIDLIRKSGLGEIEILGGSWAIPVRESPKPFLNMSRVLENSMNNPNTTNVAKMVASILWGKFVSVYPGNTLWNCFYASEVTAKMRTRLSEISLAKEKDVIAFTVDGIDLKKIPEGIMHNSSSIGGVRLSRTDKVLSLTDFYRYDWKDNKSWEIESDSIVIRTKVTLPYAVKFGGKIGDDLTVVKIPFGSSKRICPNGLTRNILEQNQFELPPPNEEECVDLFFSKEEFVPYDL